MRGQYSIVKQPGAEPVSVDDVMEHVRIDSTDDLDYLRGLITAAREYVEAITGRVFEGSTWKLVGETWGSLSKEVAGRIPLERSPLSSIVSVEYYAPDSSELSTLAAIEWREITATTPGLLQITGSMPSLEARPDAVQITFSAGCNSELPALERHAIKLMVAHLYETRAPIAFSSSSEVCYTLRSILENLKVGGVC